MKHREFITADFTGLTESERSDGSMLLGGSASEYVAIPRQTERSVVAALDAVEITESEWHDPELMVTAVIRVGDREAPEILDELHRLRAGTGSKVVMPYAVTFVMGRNLVEGVESPALSAGKILQVENRPFPERQAEIQAWVAEHGPAPELSDIPPEEAGLEDLPWRDDTARYFEQKRLESLQPMRALVLPWDESVAEELYVSNAYSELGDRRQAFFIVGRRVFTVGTGLHLNLQPE